MLRDTRPVRALLAVRERLELFFHPQVPFTGFG
jgi:hypothetical protein